MMQQLGILLENTIQNCVILVQLEMSPKLTFDPPHVTFTLNGGASKYPGAHIQTLTSF